MPSFAVRLPESSVVKEWLLTIDTRLSGVDVINLFFRGRNRYLGKGIWVWDITPVFPRVVLQVFGLCLAISGFLCWLATWDVVAFLAWGLALVIVLVGRAVHQGWLYRLVLSLQCSRLLGRWVWAADATSEVIRMRVYGTS